MFVKIKSIVKKYFNFNFLLRMNTRISLILLATHIESWDGFLFLKDR